MKTGMKTAIKINGTRSGKKTNGDGRKNRWEGKLMGHGLHRNKTRTGETDHRKGNWNKMNEKVDGESKEEQTADWRRQENEVRS
jgi:hypothetical protein